MACSVIYLRARSAAGNSLFLRAKCNSSANSFSDDSSEKDNLYKTLGIPSTAAQSEIKKAYYDLTLKYHPDRNENSDSAAIKFRNVAEAYEILGNYSLRKKYDKGVPLSLVKKNVIREIVPKDVKYQSFYDSRAVQSTSNEQNETSTKLKERPIDKFHKEMIRDMDDSNSPKQSFGGQFVLISCAFVFGIYKYFTM